jgi:uncharacterized damage-inducible protein DinB
MESITEYGSVDDPSTWASKSNREIAIMNGALLEEFRHNAWATAQLLAACRGLSEEQLASSVNGTYGGILATFNHLVYAEGGYGRRLAGAGPAWVGNEEENANLDQLEAMANDLEKLWELLLQSEPFDAERLFLLDEGTYEARAGVILAQALHHGSVHREQICAILTSLGMQPPDLQAWSWGEATGRARELPADA